MSNDTTNPDIMQMILTQPDYIFSVRYHNSIKKAMEDKGTFTDRQIASFLCVPDQYIKTFYQMILQKVRKLLQERGVEKE